VTPEISSVRKRFQFIGDAERPRGAADERPRPARQLLPTYLTVLYEPSLWILKMWNAAPATSPFLSNAIG